MEKDIVLKRQVTLSNIVGMRRIVESSINELEENLGEKIFQSLDGKHVFDRKGGQLSVNILFPLTTDMVRDILESLGEDQRQEVLRMYLKEKVS